MLKRHGRWHSKLIFTSWVVAILGIGGAGLIVPLLTWISRRNQQLFENYVGWANVLALSVGAFGTIIVILDKLGARREHKTADETNSLVNQIAKIVLRQESRNVAHLLATSELDSRCAQLKVTTSIPKQASRKKRSETKVSMSADKLTSFYLKQTDGRMVLVGTAGAGKTVLATNLLIELIKKRETTGQHLPYVPILFPAASWDISTTLEDWLIDQLILRFRLSKRDAATTIEAGLILPIIDGLDELDAEDGSPERAAAAVDRINQYIATTPNCRIVVTMRTDSSRRHERLTKSLRNIRIVEIESLTPQEIAHYLRSQIPDPAELNAWNEVLAGLQGQHADTLTRALGTPWRLNAAVVFHADGGDARDLIPNDEVDFEGDRFAEKYYQARVKFLLMHTFFRNRIFLYEKNPRKRRRIVSWLEFMARHRPTSSAATKEINEYSLHNWWKFIDPNRVRITHGLLTTTLLIFAFAATLWLSDESYADAPHSWITALGVMANRLTILVFSLKAALKDRPPSRIRFARLRNPVSIAYLAITTILAIFLGWTTSVASSYSYGILFAIIFIAISLLLASSSTVTSADGERAEHALINERNSTLILGILFGAYGFLYFNPIYGEQFGLALAIMICIGRLCASSYARYISALIYGRLQYGLPLTLRSFLNWAWQAGILRISGSGYQFRHQELLMLLRYSQ